MEPIHLYGRRAVVKVLESMLKLWWNPERQRYFGRLKDWLSVEARVLLPSIARGDWGPRGSANLVDFSWFFGPFSHRLSTKQSVAQISVGSSSYIMSVLRSFATRKRRAATVCSLCVVRWQFNKDSKHKELMKLVCVHSVNLFAEKIDSGRFFGRTF